MADDKKIFCKCLYYSANALSRIVTKMAEEEFSVVDLAPSYAFVLMTVNSNPGIQAGELAETIMLTPSTVSRLIEKLESQHLVKRHTEGRITLIYPTKKSLEKNDSIKKAWLNLYKRYADIFGNNNLHQLTENIYNAAVKLNTN